MVSNSHTTDPSLTAQVLHILDQTLSLQGHTRLFDRATRLLGDLPELDSMAVLALIGGLEDHFGITFFDEDLNAEVFATVGSLCDAVASALASASR